MIKVMFQVDKKMMDYSVRGFGLIQLMVFPQVGGGG